MNIKLQISLSSFASQDVERRDRFSLDAHRQLTGTLNVNLDDDLELSELFQRCLDSFSTRSAPLDGPAFLATRGKGLAARKSTWVKRGGHALLVSR
jgi:hypothetical protein